MKRKMLFGKNYKRILQICILVIMTLLKVSNSFPSSASHPFPEEETDVDGPGIQACLEVCQYSHSKVNCDNRNLSHIPLPTSCEEAFLLNFEGNKIASISSEQMSGYEHVSTLDLSHNLLTNIIPGTFDRNPNLKNIDVSHNFLTALNNKTFKGTEQRLSYIKIQNNSIHFIALFAFEGLEHVTHIYLGYNKLRHLLPGVFQNMISLQFLDLSRNELNYLPEKILQNSTSLETLQMNGNELQHIPNRLFDGFESLKYVFLSDNQLTTVPTPGKLCLFHQLWWLDLRNNKINQSGVIVPFLGNAGEILKVSGNPFLCDCNFNKLQNSQVVVRSQSPPIQCMYHDGSNFTISQPLPFDCNSTDQIQTAPSDNPYNTLTEIINGSNGTMPTTPPDDCIRCKEETPCHTVYVIVICAQFGVIVCLAFFVPCLRGKICPQYICRGGRTGGRRDLDQHGMSSFQSNSNASLLSPPQELRQGNSLNGEVQSP